MPTGGKYDTNQGKLEAVGRVAHSVVHDLNNLLTVVIAHASAGLRRDDPVQLKEALRQIQEASECAGKLIQSVLSMDRQAGYERTAVNVNDEVTRLMPVLETLARTHAKLTFLPQDGLDFVLADAAHISQVVLNLVVNSTEAMEDDGHIWVWTENVHVPRDHELSRRGGSLGGPFVCLHVRDTGAGMDPVVQDQMFDQGYSTKGGTGTGLATVKRIIGYYGGFLLVDSTPGRGTRISVYLPRHARSRRSDDVSDSGTHPSFRRRQESQSEARSAAAGQAF